MKVFPVLGFIITLALLALYVFQVNALVLETFQVQSYQKKVQDLTKVNRDLQVQLTKVDYLENLYQKGATLGFVRAKAVNYLQVAKDSLAAKNP